MEKCFLFMNTWLCKPPHKIVRLDRIRYLRRLATYKLAVIVKIRLLTHTQLFIGLFMSIAVGSLAQPNPEEQKQIDSLQVVIASNQHDSIKIKAINAWDNLIYRTDPQLDFRLNVDIDSICDANLARRLSKADRKYFLREKASALNIMGIVYKEQGEYEKGINVLTEGIEIGKQLNNQGSVASSYNNLGNIYKDQYLSAKALECYNEVLKICRKIDNKPVEASALNNIGALYTITDDVENAIKFYNKSLAIKEELGRKKQIASTLGNIGILYKKKEDYEMALEYYHKSLAAAEEVNNSASIASALNKIGEVYIIQDKYEEALLHLNRSLALSEGIEDRHAMATSLNKIGKVYKYKGDHTTAISYFERGHALGTKSEGLLPIRNSSNLLYQSYKATSQYKEALEMYEKFIELKEGIDSEENRNALIRQEYQYEYEKKEAVSDAEHEGELKRQKTEADASEDRQQLFTILISIVLAIVVLFLFFVFNRLRITRRQRNEIGQQKEVIEVAHKETEHQKAIIEVAHKEITDSINYAKQIQSAILPPDRQVKKHLPNSFVLYKPKDIVAGDFYWLDYSGDTLAFAAADCTGHGVPGAMVSVVCHGALNRSVREFGLTDPGQILDKTRALVIETFAESDHEVKDGMDIALCTLKEGKLSYAGANNPLWIIREGEVLETKANKQPIGVYDNPQPFTTHEVVLQPTDSVYIFSDGFVDQFGGPKGKKFKPKNLKTLLLSVQDQPMKEQLEALNTAFENWRGNLEQVDDVCIFGVRI
jgi:serine phosphatase RsbU (regulator of sigma subunit)